jgi:hypothetical protein
MFCRLSLLHHETLPWPVDFHFDDTMLCPCSALEYEMD